MENAWQIWQLLFLVVGVTSTAKMATVDKKTKGEETDIKGSMDDRG